VSSLKILILEHVDNSISDKQFNNEFSFDIPKETVRRVKGILYLDMVGYVCIITSHYVRHVKKSHPNDIKYICEIPAILENFNKVQKSIIRDKTTGASLINLEFYKKFGNDNVKLVKLKVHIKKRLELKTIFVRNE
jgi:hypothetical protein